MATRKKGLAHGFRGFSLCLLLHCLQACGEAEYHSGSAGERKAARTPHGSQGGKRERKELKTGYALQTRPSVLLPPARPLLSITSQYHC